LSNKLNRDAFPAGPVMRARMSARGWPEDLALAMAGAGGGVFDTGTSALEAI